MHAYQAEVATHVVAFLHLAAEQLLLQILAVFDLKVAVRRLLKKSQEVSQKKSVTS
jgi:hypothetical protein